MLTKPKALLSKKKKIISCKNQVSCISTTSSICIAITMYEYEPTETLDTKSICILMASLLLI